MHRIAIKTMTVDEGYLAAKRRTERVALQIIATITMLWLVGATIAALAAAERAAMFAAV